MAGRPFPTSRCSVASRGDGRRTGTSRGAPVRISARNRAPPSGAQESAMSSIVLRFHRLRADARWLVVAGCAGVFSALALTACSPRDAPAAQAAAQGTPVPPAPTAALAPAPAVAPPPVVPAPQVAAAPATPQPSGYAAPPPPQPVPPATTDDLARPEPVPMPARDA